MMKCWLLVAALFTGALLAGCGGPRAFPTDRCPGVIDSSTDRVIRTSMIDDVQDRQIVDDWDYIWLYDHESRLTYWHPTVQR